MSKRLLFFSLCFLLSVEVSAQPGGKIFQFLEVTNSARVAALGGKAVAGSDDDLNLTFHNPSLLTSSMHNNLVLNYVDYFAGINYGYASYSRSYENLGNFAAGIHYLNYGKFTGADEIGTITSEFRAADYALNLIYSRQLDSLFTFGVNLKPIYSNLESYSSFAIALDAGITYHSKDKLFSAALVLKNIGTQVTKYYPNGVREPLPFEILMGLSLKLKHAPLRFYIVGEHLEKWDLTYKTERDRENEVDPFTGEEIKEDKLNEFIDKFMRHIIIGTELNITDNFMLRFGYNYRRRQEMKIDTKIGTVGFSWGAGIKIYKFHISYARATFHQAGAPNHFSLSMNLSEFYKKF
ncbi:MAG: type IX secretion system protein PorQ [Bacteroidales bacterium]|nr:MAG: type IX secretion system protein PorQ [Bacteroidales bacterium]